MTPRKLKKSLMNGTLLSAGTVNIELENPTSFPGSFISLPQRNKRGGEMKEPGIEISLNDENYLCARHHGQDRSDGIVILS